MAYAFLATSLSPITGTNFELVIGSVYFFISLISIIPLSYCAVDTRCYYTQAQHLTWLAMDPDMYTIQPVHPRPVFVYQIQAEGDARPSGAGQSRRESRRTRPAHGVMQNEKPCEGLLLYGVYWLYCVCLEWRGNTNHW